jgi:hypothetical protein
LKRGRARLNHVTRRIEVRFADFEMNDVLALTFQFRARASTSNAVSVPSLPMRLANSIPISFLCVAELFCRARRSPALAPAVYP